MSWPLRFRTDPAPWDTPEPGDAWYHRGWGEDARRSHFRASRQYDEDWADKRPPVFIYFPGRYAASPDERYSGENPDRNGWRVTGSIEDSTLSVQPSINHMGSYHGFVTNGVLSDDVEGRIYPP